jgi:Mg2+ and Co2+ transporter CorA
MLGLEDLHRILCREQNPSSARCFYESKPALFLASGAPEAQVEVYPLNGLWNNILESKEDKLVCHVPESGLTAGDWQATDGGNSPQQKRSGDQQIGLISIRDIGHLKQYACTKGPLQVFFIRQLNSYSPLNITYSLFETLLELKKVTPQFKDYVTYMGERRREVEISPPKLRWRRALPCSLSHITNAVECMYGLRYVELNGRGDLERPTSRWSLRQTVVHNSPSRSELPASWIFITLSRVAESRLNEYLPRCAMKSACSAFGVHLLIHDTAIANWRPYLIDVAAEIDQHASRLLGASPDNQGPIGMQDCGERQDLLVLDRALLNALVVVKSTADNVRTLGEFHSYVRNMDGEDDCREEACFSIIEEQLRELEQISGRIDALRAELQSITNLLSSFLDLSSGFALQALAKESGKESERTRVLTQKSTQDAAAVKVLTILTLIYLPATVVSNFFSTSFVKAASGDPGHIAISKDWWILVAASVPLTILTLYIWYVWMRIQTHGIRPFWWPHKRGIVDVEHARIAQTNWEEKE